MKKPHGIRMADTHVQELPCVFLRMSACILLLVLFFQPISPALAALTEDSDGATQSPGDVAVEQEEDPEVHTSDDHEPLAREAEDGSSETPREDLGTETEIAADPIIEGPTPQSEDDVRVPPPTDPGTPEPMPHDITDPTPSPDIPLGDDVVGTSTSESEEPDPVVSDPVPTDPLEDPIVVPPVDVPVGDVPVLPDPVPEDTLEVPGDDSEATTTEELPVTVEQPFVAVVSNEENQYSFRDGECTRMRDDTFYCAKTTSTSTPTTVSPDGVAALADIDGDKEIFLTKDLDTVQLTQNVMEDDAPYYDPESESVVWHRLIDGRYQIMRYSLEENEEVQLTDDRYNNMEPASFGDAIVWQGWVGNDWEIMLLEDDELSMLTDNTYPDITPRINKDYILWQSFEDDAWKLKVMHRADGTIETIDGGDGASIDNPRFVLVYDATAPNGDIETRGYDLEARTIVPLSATPRELPDELPEPDQTGEDRALIQQLVQKPKTDTEGEGDGEPIGDVPTGVDENGDSPVPDIVVPVYPDEVGSSTVSVPVEDPVPALVIDPYLPPEPTPIVPDVIVPPFVGEVSEDSQP